MKFYFWFKIKEKFGKGEVWIILSTLMKQQDSDKIFLDVRNQNFKHNFNIYLANVNTCRPEKMSRNGFLRKCKRDDKESLGIRERREHVFSLDPLKYHFFSFVPYQIFHCSLNFFLLKVPFSCRDIACSIKLSPKISLVLLKWRIMFLSPSPTYLGGPR